MERRMDFSHLSSSDNTYVDSLFESYKNNPSDVDESWQHFFKGFEFALASGKAQTGESDSLSDEDIEKEFRGWAMVQSYRARGHLLSTTNPIRSRRDRKPHLALSDYKLLEEDLDRPFYIGVNVGLGKVSLRKIIDHMHKIYCKNIGVEYMHINDTNVRRWFRDKFEKGKDHIDLPMEQKKRILAKLNEAVAFESFLSKKYVGQKRFSLEGGENTIPALDAMISKSAELGAEEVVIGMAHRGRLNVLANIMGKTYEYIFNEFEGTADPDLSLGDGDVKYHLGFSSEIETPKAKKVYLKLMPNPSHLEAVAPVVLGYARSQSDTLYGEDNTKILPIIIHGDAAVAGQGVVYENLQMSGLEGYQVGGSIHFVINNQIGFTTDFADARTSNYSTSVARTLDIPVIHVNGDDAEAVVWATELASEYRHKFGKDIFIDMVCYRKHGHNEGDEPKYTQPDFYKLISKHADPRKIYTEKLVDSGQIASQLAATMQDEFKGLLQDRLNMVKQKPLPYHYQEPDIEWQNLRKAKDQDFEQSPKTAVNKKELTQVYEALIKKPEGFKLIRKAEKLLGDREKSWNEDQLDWAMGELLAYGTLLLQGVDVRLSGQDCIRGTFSHRHAELFDEETSESYETLNHISDKQARFRIFNSLLSEYGVLGFEYGYSLGRPTDINIWEAQFGDFGNGAQIIIDQFISSAESKWQRQSGLVMLLPHGYEGQGPEHSNARPERYLQLAAELNMIIANPTSPANHFHLIRRQTAWPFRKPVIIFTPKSLLRHPECTSRISDLTDGCFKEVIDDDYADAKKAKKLVLCTGKLYYDLLERQKAEKRNDVAIVRLEQLYPLAKSQLDTIFKKYAKAEKIWAQEEPLNMGYWTFLLRFERFKDFKVISRKSSASPATGYSGVHKKEQKEIIDKVFA